LTLKTYQANDLARTATRRLTAENVV